jgi:glutamate synthase domain-containing protein 2
MFGQGGFLDTFVIVIELVLLFAILAAIVAVIYMYIADRSQTVQAVRHNYPVIGRFRYMFEYMGEFFRQYFFAQDREELPFNRAERSWVYRAAKNIDSTVAFGSSRNIELPGSVIFANCPYPTLSEDAVPVAEVTIGEGCPKPYRTHSLFNISGMSFGALSKPAVQALSNGARMAGCWMSTGEGGLSPYHLEGGADIVFQIGTAKYGVRDKEGNLSDKRLRELADIKQVKMFEIKLAQGAKPGKGGILPGGKVTAEIAAIRGIDVGTDSISPNRHHDICNDDDLLDMINHVRKVTGKPVGIKTVIGSAKTLDDLCSKIVERGIKSAPDFFVVDGAEGGTGAAPQSLIDYMGLPLKESLPLVVDKLDEYGLRKRVKVICSGKMIIPSNVAWALCMGADFVVSARGFMFALGCIQALQCNKNTCPTGITTHDEKLQQGLDPENKAVRVMNYKKNMEYEVGVIAHSCGVKEPRQFRREHARIVGDYGLSVPLNVLHPDVHAKKTRAKATV